MMLIDNSERVDLPLYELARIANLSVRKDSLLYDTHSANTPLHVVFSRVI